MRVYVGGVFDLFHFGHLRLLQRAAAIGDVYVGVLTDQAAMQYKPRPIITFPQRLEIVQACRYVTLAFPQKHREPTWYGELQQVNPDVLIHGDDWNEHGDAEKWMRDQGRQVLFLPYTDKVSTTSIKKLILSRDSLGGL